MQSLFVTESNPAFDAKQAKKQLDQSIEKFFELYHYIIYTAVEVANFVQTDAEIKAAKFLPSEKDREVNAKLLSNTVKLDLEANEVFSKICDKKKFHQQKDTHIIQTLYKELSESDQYTTYLSNPMSDLNDDFILFRAIIFDFVMASEIFVEHLKDNYINIDDDGLDIERLLVKRFGKAKQKKNTSLLVFEENDKLKELKNFATKLLKSNIDKKEFVRGEFSAYLINWDASRLARVDTLLLQMALCEMLYFSEIPLKVSMNEYIDISKEYSTPKSKELINGVLDKMMKNYTQTGAIVKTGRGLMN